MIFHLFKKRQVETPVILRGFPSGRYNDVAWFPAGYTRLNGTRLEEAGWYWRARDGDCSTCPAYETDCDAHHALAKYKVGLVF